MATYSEDDIELGLAKVAIVALVLLWIALPFLISELQASELRKQPGDLTASQTSAHPAP